MRLEQKAFKSDKLFDLFPGRSPSPLAHIFASNGYEITTGFTSYYWGKKGPYVDRFISLEEVPLKNTSQCLDIGDGWLQMLRAFGVCTALGEQEKIQNLAMGIFPGAVQNPQHKKKSWHSTIIEEIGRPNILKKPKLKFFYTYSPQGHTPKNYDHRNLKQRADYQQHHIRTSKLLRDALMELTAVVKEKDPSSIVIVMGDHGTWVSRAENVTSNFFYKDRHMIYIGVLKTSHRCARKEELSHYYNISYYTPSRVIMSVLKCLARGASLGKFLGFEDNKNLSNFIDGGSLDTPQDFHTNFQVEEI